MKKIITSLMLFCILGGLQAADPSARNLNSLAYAAEQVEAEDRSKAELRTPYSKTVEMLRKRYDDACLHYRGELRIQLLERLEHDARDLSHYHPEVKTYFDLVLSHKIKSNLDRHRKEIEKDNNQQKSEAQSSRAKRKLIFEGCD